MNNPTILCIDTVTRIMGYQKPYSRDAWDDMLLYPAIEHTVNLNHETLQKLLDNYIRMYGRSHNIKQCQDTLNEWYETMRQHMEG